MANPVWFNQTFCAGVSVSEELAEGELAEEVAFAWFCGFATERAVLGLGREEDEESGLMFRFYKDKEGKCGQARGKREGCVLLGRAVGVLCQSGVRLAIGGCEC